MSTRCGSLRIGNKQYNTAMGVKALGGYIEGLIAQHDDLSLASVQDAAGVRQNYVWKLVNGTIKAPGAGTVRALVRAARGSVIEAIEILASETMSQEDGYKAGRSALSDAELLYFASLSPEQKDIVRGVVERLKSQRHP
jgi:hypothetical protein